MQVQKQKNLPQCPKFIHTHVTHCPPSQNKLKNSNQEKHTYIFPSGKGRLERIKSPQRIDFRSVLGEHSFNQTVQNALLGIPIQRLWFRKTGSFIIRRGWSLSTVLGKLLGEAMEDQEIVQHGSAFLWGGPRVGRIRVVGGFVEANGGSGWLGSRLWQGMQLGLLSFSGFMHFSALCLFDFLF
jgi:hypothetical protein